MERLIIGILAHVDAGKTTLTEGILYRSGRIRALGRVDHGDAYLDTEALEKERGITIFSKQAVFPLGEKSITLLDTPGHVDFSAEMERTLSVLDYAILLVSSADGMQGHTETLWRLLSRYQIPTFLFVNKMDQPAADRSAILRLLQDKLSRGILDFSELPAGNPEGGSGGTANAGEELLNASEELLESIALTDEDCMERYLSEGELRFSELRRLIRERKLFPVFFGSALKLTGIEELLSGLSLLTEAEGYPEERSGRVLKIGRAEDGQRLTFLKLTGGELKNREELLPGEKITQLRIYSGARYEAAERAEPGELVAVTGIRSLRAGERFGEHGRIAEPLLRPVLEYEMLPEGGASDKRALYRSLSGLRDELPELELSYDSALSEIRVRLMGEVQTEVLKRMIEERLGISVAFGDGKILYRETITAPAEGVGHFEPLRHYAELHVLLEPLPRGSGIEVVSDCPEDVLGKSWQHTVLQQLRSREHIGVLTGSPLTDVRIRLLTGRAHLKHTEGGDFREAGIRAVRQGLRKADCIVLEPYYRFTAELPQEALGRAMTELDRRNASLEAPELRGESAVLRGRAPVSAMRNYARELRSYTGGKGEISLEPDGYDRCIQEAELIARRGYDPDADLRNPCASVFCAHGTGFLVPYDEVERYMHVPSPLAPPKEKLPRQEPVQKERETAGESYREAGYYIGDRELEDIFTRTYGSIKNRAAIVSAADARVVRAKEREENLRKAREERAGQGERAGTGRESARKAPEAVPEKKEYLLVDGYNIIYAWEELSSLAAVSLDGARGRLLDILSNYQGYTGKELIVVFDAYRVQGHAVESFRMNRLHVVYTKEAQTADQYIEKLSHSLSREQARSITVATSDRMVQVIVWSGSGVSILSAQELEREIERVNREIRDSEHMKSSAVPGPRIRGGMELPEQS